LRCGSLFVLLPEWTENSPSFNEISPGFRRDIRLQSAEMQALIDADVDCTNAARLLMRMQADLVLFIEKRERLKNRESA
jgi:hypothetical protein